MAGDQIFRANPEITTTAGALSLGPVNTAARYRVLVRNCYPTNEVWLSFNGGTNWPVVILPGEIVGPFVVAASQNLWADGQVGTCTCEVLAVEI